MSERAAAQKNQQLQPATKQISGILQRACACGNHTVAGGECAECSKKKQTLQRATLSHRGRGTAGEGEVPAIVHEVLRSPGQPLDPATRAFFEPRFAYDFSQVRAHTDAHAAESVLAVNASAYTVGWDIVFGEQQYAPLSDKGQRLLAHELNHVVQQNGSSREVTAVSPALEIGAAHDAHEQEAERVAAQTKTPTFGCGGQTGSLRLQRAPLDARSAAPQIEGRRVGPDASARRGGTLPYREATELLNCIRIMGEQSAAYCRQEVLGEVPPRPIQPTHHELPGITTPQPINVQLNPNSTTNFQVNGANVVFNPDAHSTDQAMANRAETNFNFVYGAINPQAQSGSITSFTGPGALQVTIRTTYGKGASRTGPSGYGRGTTAPDITAGATSLGFHEGQHGLDFIEFLQQNPVPQFLGRVGMTVAAFQTEMATYRTAMDHYRDQMYRFTTDRTDCVGRTIDQHNLMNGFVTTICQQVPAGGGGIP